jgi:hypothetical protein
MDPQGSLPHSQEPATCSYPEPDRSNPCQPSHFSKIHWNIILQYMPGPSKWSPSLRLLAYYPDICKTECDVFMSQLDVCVTLLELWVALAVLCIYIYIIFRQSILVVYRSKRVNSTQSHKQPYSHMLVISFGYLLAIIRPKTCGPKITNYKITHALLPVKVKWILMLIETWERSDPLHRDCENIKT